MPKYTAYSKDDTHSYALGIYPSMELLLSRPEAAKTLLLKSKDGQGEGIEKLSALCAKKNIPIEEAPKALQRISSKENCYAALVFEKYESPICAARDHVMLVNPSDAGNVGSIMRSMLGFGYKDLVIVRPGVDPFDPRVLRASMGAAFHLNIAVIDDFCDYRRAFGEASRSYYLFRLQNAMPLGEVRRKGQAPVSLVFGNEQSGLPEALLGFGSGVMIEQTGPIDSLNLSVAAGIGLYAFKKEG